MLLTFEKGIYDKLALLKTAYQFSDKVFLHLSQDEGHWLVSWHAKEEEQLSPEVFENEMIQQQLRLMLIRDNGDVRKLLLARALASTVMETAHESDVSAVALNATEDVLKGWFAQHETD